MGEAAATGRFAVPRRARAGWWRAIRTPRFSVRTHVVGLILVIIAPLLAFSAFLVLRSAAEEQEFMANAVRERTRAAAAAIDHELGALRTRLFILAASRALQVGNLDAFRSEATAAVASDGLSVVLTDPGGRELLNTATGPEAQLGMAPDPETVRHVAETLLPDVSLLGRDSVSGEFRITLNVPVIGGRGVLYVLSLNIAPLLPRMLDDLNLPPEWLATLDDRAGVTIARSREADRFVGQAGRPEALVHLRTADEGWFPLETRDGIPAYNAFAHVSFSGWTVALSIPDAVLFAPVRRSTWILILAGGAAVALALALASSIGHGIAYAINGLVGYADQVGRGERGPPPPTGITEADAVAQSLHMAGERLHQNAQERSVLLDRTITAQEAERKRIARELHDSLGQYLTALRLGLGAIEPHCAPSEPARHQLSELKTLAAALGRELNRIAWELRPMALDDLGLHRAVSQYLEEWAERSRLHIDLEIDLAGRRLPQPVETALFRVLQEAVGNVLKHSGADRVGVVLQANEREVRLIVEDNGRGFIADPGQQGRKHFGLAGLRERLTLAGGMLEVESSETGGTTLYASIPV
jgi:signal transduction histidine kinase